MSDNPIDEFLSVPRARQGWAIDNMLEQRIKNWANRIDESAEVTSEIAVENCEVAKVVVVVQFHIACEV
jgi:hypothetical protein